MNVAAEIEKLREYCKERSIPLTQQRLEVYRELVWSRDHPSPEEIHRHLREKYPTISLATVYNNLEALSRMGFARKINPLSDHARFDGDTSEHCHFICTSCKSVYDVDPKTIKGAIVPDPDSFDHEITRKQIQYVGICNLCINNTREGN
jgi:Fur family peroxide stress response transcriptional regulator